MVPVTPRCDRPMRRFEAVHGPLLEDPVCGRPAGHNGACRSVQGLRLVRERERARAAGRNRRRRARRLRARLAAVVQAAAAQARERARAA